MKSPSPGKSTTVAANKKDVLTSSEGSECDGKNRGFDIGAIEEESMFESDY